MNRIAQAIVLGLSLLSPFYAAEETAPLRDVVDHVSLSVVGVIVELSEPTEPRLLCGGPMLSDARVQPGIC